MDSIVNMRVNLDKNFDKDVYKDNNKTAIGYPPKSVCIHEKVWIYSLYRDLIHILDLQNFSFPAS